MAETPVKTRLPKSRCMNKWRARAQLELLPLEGRIVPSYFPSTANGIHVFEDQLPSMSSALVKFMATHTDGTQKQTLNQINALRAVNPNYTLIHYQLGSGNSPYDYIINNQWSSDWNYVNQQESWFAHQTYSGEPQSASDLGSGRVGNSTGWDQADIANPAWQNYTLGQVFQNMAATGATGWFADSYTYGIGGAGYDGTIPTRYQGTNAANAAYWPGGITWTTQLTNWAQVVDNAFAQHNANFGTNYQFIPNIDALVTSWEPSWYLNSSGVPILDGAFLENFGQYTDTYDWTLSMNRALKFTDNNKIVILEPYLGDTPDSATSQQERNFYLGTYLLLKGNESYFNMIYGGGAQYFPEYQLNLGTATTALPTNVSSYLWNGVYRRDFQNGFVLVNPGSTSYTLNLGGAYQLVQGHGGGTLTDAQLDANGNYIGGSLTYQNMSSITMAGGTAAIFLNPAVGPPARLAFGTQPASTPTGATLPAVTVQVLDANGNLVTSDSTDMVTISVGSGPGSFLAGSTTTATVHNGVATFNNLILVVPGSYQLSTALSGQFTTNSAAFTVQPLEVVPGSFTGGPSGFSLQFNTAFLVNSTTPVLYGKGFGSTAPVPSVTLAQTKDAGGHAVNNPVTGSLVLNTATRTITFLSTDYSLLVNAGSALLPDGTYAVVVHGTAAGDGFQALNNGGGFLDGVGSGTPGSGDYTQTFVVNAAAAHDDVVWVPPTADGPGEVLNAPGMNRAGGGYPIYLSDTTGTVTKVQLTLNYNPALLTVTGVTGAGFSLLSSSSPGQAVLQYSGPALPAGVQTPIGFLTASVPAGTSTNPVPYKSADLLHLSNVSLNGGAVPVATSDGLHLVAYVGDADASGSYSANDAVLITRALLSTDSGFTAYPLVDPVIVADTDGSGFIPADAALQANEAGVGLPAPNLPVPPIPTGVHFLALIQRANLNVSTASVVQNTPTISVDATALDVNFAQLGTDTDGMPGTSHHRRRIHVPLPGSRIVPNHPSPGTMVF
jgi:Hypothetical glycosyl hydrolase family 15